MPEPGPALSRAQLRELDRRAQDEGGVSIETLMENAGSAAAEEAQRMLESSGKPKPWNILILCGSGNNGGDGLAAARILNGWLNQGISNSGSSAAARVETIFLKPADRLEGAALKHFERFKQAGLSSRNVLDGAVSTRGYDLIIDAILGTGFDGALQEPLSRAIEAVNASGVPVLSIDIPSGLNADSGKAQGACIRAGKTVTFAAMKKGFLNPESRAWTGKIVLRDIGIPQKILDATIQAGG